MCHSGISTVPKTPPALSAASPLLFLSSSVLPQTCTPSSHFSAIQKPCCEVNKGLSIQRILALISMSVGISLLTQTVYQDMACNDISFLPERYSKRKYKNKILHFTTFVLYYIIHRKAQHNVCTKQYSTNQSLFFSKVKAVVRYVALRYMCTYMCVYVHIYVCTYMRSVRKTSSHVI